MIDAVRRPTPPAALRRRRPCGERHARALDREIGGDALAARPRGRCSTAATSIAIVKAKARLGLAILAFAAHLLRHRAAAGDVCGAQATATAPAAASTQDAVATARPDILDRNGHDSRHRREDALAVCRAAQDHRRGRGGRTADRDAARSRRQRIARAAVVQARLRLAQARDHAAAAAGNPPARHSRRRLSHREQARLSRTGRWSRT